MGRPKCMRILPSSLMEQRGNHGAQNAAQTCKIFSRASVRKLEASVVMPVRSPSSFLPCPIHPPPIEMSFPEEAYDHYIVHSGSRNDEVWKEVIRTATGIYINSTHI